MRSREARARKGVPVARPFVRYRRGASTHFLTEDVPENVVSDCMNVSREALDEHYDRPSEEVKLKQRRECLAGT